MTFSQQNQINGSGDKSWLNQEALIHADMSNHNLCNNLFLSNEIIRLKEELYTKCLETNSLQAQLTECKAKAEDAQKIKQDTVTQIGQFFEALANLYDIEVKEFDPTIARDIKELLKTLSDKFLQDKSTIIDFELLHVTNYFQILYDLKIKLESTDNNDLCDTVAISTRKYHRINVTRSKYKQYFCVCNRPPFKSEIHLTRHIELYNSRDILSCEFCQAQFDSPSYFRFHLKRNHKQTDNSTLKCQVCNTTFDGWSSYRHHLKVVQ